MRIWSLHPKYLDVKGLLALWRETLLAKHVLEGKTKGYKNHPQLNRFKEAERPVDTVNQYLSVIYDEALFRGYKFDRTKVDWNFKPIKLAVTRGQINFEVQHLCKKLKIRDENKHKTLMSEIHFDSHPLFKVIEGDIELWEIL